MDGQINQGKQQRCCRAGAAAPECAASCPAGQEETTASTENWFQPYLDACNEAKKYKAMYDEAIEALKAVCRLI